MESGFNAELERDIFRCAKGFSLRTSDTSGRVVVKPENRPHQLGFRLTDEVLENPAGLLKSVISFRENTEAPSVLLRAADDSDALGVILGGLQAEDRKGLLLQKSGNPACSAFELAAQKDETANVALKSVRSLEEQKELIGTLADKNRAAELMDKLEPQKPVMWTDRASRNNALTGSGVNI